MSIFYHRSGVFEISLIDNNWSANSRESLIQKIKKCATEIDQDIIIKIFDNLKNRIHLANENGLESLL